MSVGARPLDARTSPELPVSVVSGAPNQSRPRVAPC